MTTPPAPYTDPVTNLRHGIIAKLLESCKLSWIVGFTSAQLIYRIQVQGAPFDPKVDSLTSGQLLPFDNELNPGWLFVVCRIIQSE